MIVFKTQLFFTTIIVITHNYVANSTPLSVKDIFKPKVNPETSETDLLAIIRVPRDTVGHQIQEPENTENSGVAAGRRKARDSKYYSDKYSATYKDGEREDRSLKPEDHLEDDRGTKSSTSLGKRCSTCDTGYSRGSSSRGRYDRYDRDPYSSSSRTKYDPYDRYDRDRYYDRYDRYDDYDRDGYRDYRGRNKYSTSYYDRYDPRDRYYDKGLGYDNRGYDYRERDYYSPYSRDRYDAYSPYDDYYSRGYDSYSSRGSYGRPDTYGSGGYSGSGGYARGYSYGDRDRYGGYGSGYGGGYGSSGYGSSYGGSRSRYPSYDYDSGYRHTSYLYGRPSSTTTDTPKSSDGEQSNTSSPQGNTSG